MVTGFDLRYVLIETLQIVTIKINLPLVPLILYTDLFLLYKCFVKLNITREKRLIIDIIVLQQSYKYKKAYTVQ